MMVYKEGALFNKNIIYFIKYFRISWLRQYFSQCTLHRHQDKAADGRSFSKRKRLWFVTIVQYINQSWIYCEKWNSPAAPQQLRLGLLRRLHLHLRLRRPSSLFDLQHSVFSLQSRFFSLQSSVPSLRIGERLQRSWVALRVGRINFTLCAGAATNRCSLLLCSPFPPPDRRTPSPSSLLSAVLWVTLPSMRLLSLCFY